MVMVARNDKVDFPRFLLSIFTVITPIFAPKAVQEKQEWLLELTNNKFSFSAIGKSCFLTISDYLVDLSLLRSKNFRIYFKKTSITF
jgi:hypothetical protein